MTDSAFMRGENDQQYVQHRGVLSEYTRSEQFGIVHGIRPGDTVLDIGCNNGRLYNAVRQHHGKVAFTGIDMDERAVQMAVDRYGKEVEFIVGKYPSPEIEGRRFNDVISFAVLPLIRDWRGILKTIANQATDRMILDLAMTMDFPTQDHPDLSYVYYLDSGIRVPYVVLNVYHFVNFCFTEYIDAESVEIVATVPSTTSSFHGLPNGKLLRGVAIVHKDHSGKKIFGAQTNSANPKFMKKFNKSDFRSVEATIDIDGTVTRIYPRASIF